MKGLVERWYRMLASGKLVLALLVLYIFSQMSIGLLLHRLGSGALRLQTTFCRDVFVEILQSWGAQGAAVYMRHFYLDFFHPVIYSLLLASCIAFFTASQERGPGRFYLALFVLPFFAGLCDLVENILHVGMIRGWLPITDAMVFTSGTFTNTKWAAAGVCIVAVIVLGLKKAVSGLKRKG